MPKAVWNGVVLAESDDVKVVEGNYYFPPESLKEKFFRESSSRSLCFWKGLARYYTIEANGQMNEDAAWYYPRPSFLARKIKNHVAFWKGVRVEQ